MCLLISLLCFSMLVNALWPLSCALLCNIDALFMKYFALHCKYPFFLFRKSSQLFHFCVFFYILMFETYSLCPFMQYKCPFLWNVLTSSAIVPLFLAMCSFDLLLCLFILYTNDPSHLPYPLLCSKNAFLSNLLPSLFKCALLLCKCALSLHLSAFL